MGIFTTGGLNKKYAFARNLLCKSQVKAFTTIYTYRPMCVMSDSDTAANYSTPQQNPDFHCLETTSPIIMMR
jgi:hypothetical protein